MGRNVNYTSQETNVRKNSKGYRNPRHDTRMSFKHICRVLGISPVQRVKLIKYMKEGEHIK